MSEVAEEKNLDRIVKAAVEKHAALADSFIPILLEINNSYGFIPAEAIRLVRRELHLSGGNTPVSQGRLYGLASFYKMLSTEKTGRHVVQFCESAPCHVQGGRELWEALQQELNLKSGQTDPQGRFTLKTVSCIGVCGVGPLIQVDDDLYGNVTAAQLPQILAGYE